MAAQRGGWRSLPRVLAALFALARMVRVSVHAPRPGPAPLRAVAAPARPSSAPAPASPTAPPMAEPTAVPQPGPDPLSASSTLGWLPALSVVIALGLFIVSWADQRARFGLAWADEIFWAGLLVLYVPVVVRLAMAGTARVERAGLVVLLGLALYLVKLLHSPTGFSLPDEFYHWRTTNDILLTDRLFADNPLLPVSALYPAIESVTAALADLGGLSIFAAGAIVAGASRLVLTLALFLLFERLASSARVGGLATAFYMTNPNFLFFGAMYKYETIALAFAALALYLIARRPALAGREGRIVGVLAVLTLLGLAMAHHMTAYLLTGILALWVALALVLGWFGVAERRVWRWPAVMLGVSAAFNVLWLLAVAPTTIGYLSPVLTGAIEAVVDLIASEAGVTASGDGEGEAGRELFVTTNGVVPMPAWERLLTIGSVLLILLLIPVGLWQLWRRYRPRPLALALGVAALLYPASLVFRLTGGGWESANRSSESVYVALGFTLAVGIVWTWLARVRTRLAVLPLAPFAAALLIGGIVAGWSYEWRLPRPYQPAEDPLSIEEQGIRAAQWALRERGPDTIVGADRTSHLLWGSYGAQEVSTTISGGITAQYILFSPEITAQTFDDLRAGRIQLLVVDLRLIDAPWIAQSYYAGVDPAVALRKFDQVQGFDRVMDSGDIVVYDVSAFSSASDAS